MTTRGYDDTHSLHTNKPRRETGSDEAETHSQQDEGRNERGLSTLQISRDTVSIPGSSHPTAPDRSVVASCSLVAVP
jgi:hypothetical protein